MPYQRYHRLCAQSLLRQWRCMKYLSWCRCYLATCGVIDSPQAKRISAVPRPGRVMRLAGCVGRLIVLIIDIRLLGDLSRPIPLLKLGVEGLVPKPRPPLALPLLGIGMLFFVIFQKLSNIGLVAF